MLQLVHTNDTPVTKLVLTKVDPSDINSNPVLCNKLLNSFGLVYNFNCKLLESFNEGKITDKEYTDRRNTAMQLFRKTCMHILRRSISEDAYEDLFGDFLLTRQIYDLYAKLEAAKEGRLEVC